jgi:hypothetical protein
VYGFAYSNLLWFSFIFIIFFLLIIYLIILFSVQSFTGQTCVTDGAAPGLERVVVVVVVVFIPDVATYVHVAMQGVLDPDLLPRTPEL